MINYLIKKRVAQQQFRNQEITPIQLEGAKTVLFSVFSRYGEGIIAFKIINEFIARHPDKIYYILTSHQLRPYAAALVNSRVNVLSVRKRSPHQLIWTIWHLKQANIDIGLNPWGSRGDSEFFITFAKNFYTFGSVEFKITDNLYFRVRRYLGLPPPAERENLFAISQPVCRILISPLSTDIRKSLGHADLIALLEWLKNKFPEARTTIALAQGEEDQVGELADRDFFIFGKSEARSRQFLNLVKEVDLFVGVDAGPLHLADALGKPCLGIFGPTAPETVMDAVSRIQPLRSQKLQGIFCAIKTCPEPHCLHALFQGDPEKHRHSASQRLEQERTVCRFLNPSREIRV